MRQFLFFPFLAIVVNCQAQSLQPLTEAELDSTCRRDKLNGTLQEWSKADVKAFRRDCEKQLGGKISAPKTFCSCAQKVVAENLNYTSFKDQSEYQQGRTLGYLTSGSCR